MNRRIGALFLALAILGTASAAGAAEIGHFNGGILNLRDYLLPDPGIYGGVYNYYYATNRLNDSRGDKIKSVTITPPGGGSGVTIPLYVHVNMYAIAPALVWVTDIEPLAIKYGALITPTFANVNLNAAAQIAFARGGNINAGGYGVGDLYVQPVWLGKTLQHWDFALAYGFYAPTGKYATELVTVPGVGSVKTEASDNIGYGFWTHQVQGSAAWYPMENKGTALISALTYETNGKKQGFDLTPGDNLTLTWGASQFLPLREDSLLLEFGPAGYDTWQITDDTGSAASDTRDQVHAVGGQLGVTYLPWLVSLNFHGFYEYLAKNRFQGDALGLNLSKKF